MFKWATFREILLPSQILLPLVISVLKEKFGELKADFFSEIKELINLEVEKTMKK